MKSINVVWWPYEWLRHLQRHGDTFTFCSVDLSYKDMRSFPLWKMRNDAPTCLRCVGRAICGSRR